MLDDQADEFDLIRCRRFAAYVDGEVTRLVSRADHVYKRFDDLCHQVSAALPKREAILDGEIACVDRQGRPKFYDLMFRRGTHASRRWTFSSSMARTSVLCLYSSAKHYSESSFHANTRTFSMLTTPMRAKISSNSSVKWISRAL
jgi:hypothetical protein